MKILIVDDDVSGLISLKELMGISQLFYVDVAETFDKALALLEKNYYECVITDIFLDKNTGYDILQHARKKNPVVPVIGMTGFNEIMEFKEKFDSIFLKPYSFNQLHDKVVELIRRNYFVRIISDPEDLGGLDYFFEASFDYNVYVTEEYLDVAKKILDNKLSFYRGAVVPAIISGSVVLEKGMMFVRHSKNADVSIMDLDNIEQFKYLDKKTFMIFYDHHCNLSSLETVIKNSNYDYCFGIGCGYKDENVKTPAIFDKDGFCENSALVLQFDKKFKNIHYSDYLPVYGPLNFSWEKNLLKGINGKDALSFYLDRVKNIAGECFVEHSNCGIHHPIGLLDPDTGNFTFRIPERYDDISLHIKGGDSDVSSMGYIAQHKKELNLFKDLLEQFKAEINIGTVIFNYPYHSYREFGEENFGQFIKIAEKYFPDESFIGYLSYGIISSELANCQNPVSHLGVLIGNIE